MHLWEIQQTEHKDSPHYWPQHETGHEYLGICLAGEVGEVCNELKKFSRGDYTKDETARLIFAELADILIYLVMLAQYFGISLEEAYKVKKEWNEQRFRKATT